MNVFVTALGCKLNQAEAESMQRGLVAAGYRLVADLEQADVHLVHTCTVTAEAARDSRRAARRGARLGRGVRTVVTGCWTAGNVVPALALDGVALVVPPPEQDRLVELISRSLPPARSSVPAAWFGRTRAAIKIEDGCAMRCSFCVIPHTRGGQRSRPAREVVAEVAARAAEGVQEVILTGVQISAYRDGRAVLYDLVSRVLAETQVPRLRLTSIAPWQFERRLLGLFSSGRLCRHVHLSLQSGCDATLRRMRRPYAMAAYRELVAEVRAASDGMAITSDLIAGFPGETGGEFAATLAAVADLAFARLHVFAFSARPGTAAATMTDRVAPDAVRERVSRLRENADRAAAAFARSQVGRAASVVWERPRRGLAVGTTDNYLRARSRFVPLGARDTVLVEQADQGGVWVRPLAEGQSAVEANPPST